MIRPVGPPGRPNRGALLLPVSALNHCYILHMVTYRERTVLARPFTLPLKVSSPSSSHSTDAPSLSDDDLKKEAAVIIDPVRSRPTLAADSTGVQMLLTELLAGMTRPSNYCEEALWMRDQPLDWPQVPKSTQKIRSRFWT